MCMDLNGLEEFSLLATGLGNLISPQMSLLKWIMLGFKKVFLNCENIFCKKQ